MQYHIASNRVAMTFKIFYNIICRLCLLNTDSLLCKLTTQTRATLVYT